MARLKLPEGWTASTKGESHIYAKDSITHTAVLQWREGHLATSSSYRDRCNQHRMMYRICPKFNTWEWSPIPEEISTFQEAVDYVYVLSRLS